MVRSVRSRVSRLSRIGVKPIGCWPGRRRLGASELGDPASYRAGNLARSWRRFWQGPLMQREIWDRLREYNRADFHPSNRDTTALIEHWRAELFASDGALIDKLAVA